MKVFCQILINNFQDLFPMKVIYEYVPVQILHLMKFAYIFHSSTYFTNNNRYLSIKEIVEIKKFNYNVIIILHTPFVFKSKLIINNSPSLKIY